MNSLSLSDSSVLSQCKLSHLPVSHSSLMNHVDLLFPQNCRANQGVACLTEGYRAREWDSLTHNNNQQQTPLPTTKTQPHLIWKHGNLCDCLQYSSVSPAMVISRRFNLVQPRRTAVPTRPLLLLWWALDLALLLQPTRFGWIPLLKMIAIVSINDTTESHCVLCPYLWRMQQLVIYF